MSSIEPNSKVVRSTEVPLATPKQGSKKCANRLATLWIGRLKAAGPTDRSLQDIKEQKEQKQSLEIFVAEFWEDYKLILIQEKYLIQWFLYLTCTFNKFSIILFRITTAVSVWLFFQNKVIDIFIEFDNDWIGFHKSRKIKLSPNLASAAFCRIWNMKKVIVPVEFEFSIYFDTREHHFVP